MRPRFNHHLQPASCLAIDMCWIADQDNIESDRFIQFTQPGKRKSAKIMYQSEATTQIGNEVDNYGAQEKFIF